MTAATFTGQDERGVDFALADGRRCRLELPTDGGVRVLFLGPDGPRQPRSWMIADATGDTPWEGRDRLADDGRPPLAYSVDATPERVTVTLPGAIVDITLARFGLTWKLPDGRVFASDRESRPYAFGRRSPSIAHAMARHPQDRYWGLGDKTGPLDHHGRRLRTVMTDALGFHPEHGDPLYKHWPFVIVRDGATGTVYGLFYDNLAPATFDLGAEHSNYYGLYRSYEAADGDLDYRIIPGPRLADVVAGFTRLTGAMAFGPRWSLGFAQTAMSLADAPDAQARMTDFVARCEAQAIPISAFHFGSGYSSIGKKRYVFTWNHDKFPDPPALMRTMHTAGMRIVANLKPCLLDDHPLYDAAAQDGAFILDTATAGPGISQFWDGEGAHLDFTNPAGIAWWQRGLRDQILAMGMDCGWNDNNEYELWNEDAQCHGFGTAVDLDLVRPIQALLMTRATHEEQARAKPDERPFTVTRAGCPGIQRFAQTWSGDNATGWESLRWNLRLGLTMSLSGMFNIGHDVGGFSGPVPEPELFLRWVQAGLLHPRFIMNSWKADGTVTTPWLHDETTPAARWAIRLRYRLMPYLYSLYRRAADEGEPILRPTFYDYDMDPACLAENDELMLGPNLLAAPVVTQGVRQRSLYLPRRPLGGPAGWYEFETETWHPAGTTITVAAPLDRLPLMVPEGAILPLTDNPEDFSALHDEPSRCLRLFPARGTARSSFTLYEDDGLSHGHAAGDWTRLTFTMSSDAQEIRLQVERSGSFALPYDRITVALPAAETRPLVLEQGTNAPTLSRGPWRMHAL